MMSVQLLAIGESSFFNHYRRKSSMKDRPWQKLVFLQQALLCDLYCSKTWSVNNKIDHKQDSEIGGEINSSLTYFTKLFEIG